MESDSEINIKLHFSSSEEDSEIVNTNLKESEKKDRATFNTRNSKSPVFGSRRRFRKKISKKKNDLQLSQPVELEDNHMNLIEELQDYLDNPTCVNMTETNNTFITCESAELYECNNNSQSHYATVQDLLDEFQDSDHEIRNAPDPLFKQDDPLLTQHNESNSLVLIQTAESDIELINESGVSFSSDSILNNDFQSPNTNFDNVNVQEGYILYYPYDGSSEENIPLNLDNDNCYYIGANVEIQENDDNIEHNVSIKNENVENNEENGHSDIQNDKNIEDNSITNNDVEVENNLLFDEVSVDVIAVPLESDSNSVTLIPNELNSDASSNKIIDDNHNTDDHQQEVAESIASSDASFHGFTYSKERTLTLILNESNSDPIKNKIIDDNRNTDDHEHEDAESIASSDASFHGFTYSKERTLIPNESNSDPIKNKIIDDNYNTDEDAESIASSDATIRSFSYCKKRKLSISSESSIHSCETQINHSENEGDIESFERAEDNASNQSYSTNNDLELCKPVSIQIEKISDKYLKQTYHYEPAQKEKVKKLKKKLLNVGINLVKYKDFWEDCKRNADKVLKFVVTFRKSMYKQSISTLVRKQIEKYLEALELNKQVIISHDERVTRFQINSRDKLLTEQLFNEYKKKVQRNTQMVQQDIIENNKLNYSDIHKRITEIVDSSS